MRQATGYMCDDGTFFDFAEEAVLYEAMAALQYRAKHVGVDPERLFRAVDTLRGEIERYINARKSLEASEATNPVIVDGHSTTGPDNSDDGRAKIIDAAIHQFAYGRSKSVPDVGSGEHAKKVSDGSTVHGAGSGQHHAPSIRGYQDLAGIGHTEREGGSRGSSPTHIQRTVPRSDLESVSSEGTQRPTHGPGIRDDQE